MELQNYMNNISQVNVTWLMKQSEGIDPILAKKFATNRNVDPPAFYILIILYGLLIVIGTLGNMLVVITVARKPAMRTARNLFILNLAISDMLLCLITMPLTLMEILSKYWPLGKHTFVCKMTGTLQATSIFVSTISITAIALDRYHVIIYATRDNLQVAGALTILSLIWLVALLLASPMFMIRTLEHHDVHIESLGIDGISYCVEKWPIARGRFYYSIASLIAQYVLPILIVSISYFQIYYKLKYRYVATGAVPTVPGQNSPANIQAPVVGKNRGRRMRRMNSLLISIAVIFCISWLPLNIFNVWADLWTEPVETHRIAIYYAICHMMGMSSACSNPLLYGWLNDNFRKEFKDILSCRQGGDAGNRSTELVKRNASQRKLSLFTRNKGDMNTTMTTSTPSPNNNCGTNHNLGGSDKTLYVTKC